MNSQPKVPDLMIATALVEHSGNLTLVAKALSAGLRTKIARGYIRKRIDCSAALMGLVEEISETIADYAEGAIADAIIRGDTDVSKFYLLTIGKDRGYTRTLIVEDAGAAALAKRLFDAREAAREREDRTAPPPFRINGAPEMVPMLH